MSLVFFTYDASQMESFQGGDLSLLRVTVLHPGVYFLGLQKLRNWPRKFLDKWFLTGRARAPSWLGTLTGIHTRLYDESVLLAVLPCESSNPWCLLRDSHCVRPIEGCPRPTSLSLRGCSLGRGSKRIECCRRHD